MTSEHKEKLLSESLLSFPLVVKKKVNKEVYSAAIGHRKTSLYRRWLERINLPKETVGHLPQVNLRDTVPLGCESQRLYDNLHTKLSKHQDIESDNEDEEDETSSDSVTSEEENEEEDEEDSESDESSSSESSIDSDRAHEINKDYGNEIDLKVKDMMSRNFAREPSVFVPHPIPESFHTIVQNEEENVVNALPGLASQEKPILKSRGGQDFVNYYGKWERATIQGYGGYLFADGGTYEGDWVNNQPHGYGRSEFPDGSFYEGDWKHGIRHGKGRSESAGGIYYEGEYVQGKRNGNGVLKFPKGAIYIGEFVDGMFHGRGEMTTRMGYKYNGTWQKGLIAGSGALTLKEGERIVRKWPPNTLNALVEQLMSEKEEKERKRFEAKQELYRVINKTELDRYVKNVRDEIQREKEEKRKAEEEEMDRLRRERREQLVKAKEEAMKAAAGQLSETSNKSEIEEDKDDDKETDNGK